MEGSTYTSKHKERSTHKKSKHLEKKKRKRKHYSSSSESEWSSDTTDSDSNDYRHSHKAKRKKKHTHKERKKKRSSHHEKSSKAKKYKKHKTAHPKTSDLAPTTAPENPTETKPAPPVASSAAVSVSKSKGPMTREEYEKQQSVVRRVFDPDTGRHRLVKGDGEIIEEIVSKDRHRAINKQATMGDGLSFQKELKKFL